MMDRIQVGFIGLGRIADLHQLVYQGNREAVICAVCDAREDIARKRQKEWNTEKCYTDYRQMLADPEIDAVEILTPHMLHEKMVLDAAVAGKHIALQKPMTVSLESADRMLEAVAGSKTVFKVTDNYLFYPPIVLAKKLIEEGAIGNATNIRIKMTAAGSGGWQVPDAAWEWRLAESTAGRGLQTFDHGHHLWAAAWYLLGEVERVVSWIDSVDGIVDSPAVMMWKYKGRKAYGTCEYSFSPDMSIPSRYYANDEWIEITGSKGIIMILRCTGNLLDGPAMSLYRKNRWEHFDHIDSDWAQGFVGSTQNFIRAIRGEEAPLLNGYQAKEILKMNLAVAESSQIRKEICLGGD